MVAERQVVAALRVFLVLLFGIFVVFQVMSPPPGQFAHMAEENPDLAYLRWPTAVTVFWVLCMQG